MKKLFSLFLAVMMLLPALMSCGESKENTDAAENPAGNEAGTNPTVQTEPETEEDPLSDGLPDTDLAGYDFRIYSMLWTDGVETAARMISDEFTGDAINDALRESTLSVEDRFNCSIRMIEGGDVWHIAANVTNSIQAGDDAFEIVGGHDGTMTNLMNQGLFYNIRKVPQFNFDKAWWGPSKVLEINGKMYLASSYLSYTGLHWTRALMTNKRIFDDLGLEIPYETVREGTWTLDKMIALTENTYVDLNGNGRKDIKDQIGLCTGVETLYCLQESLDISPYHRNNDGTIAMEFDIERMDTVVNKLRALNKTDGFTYKSDSAFTSEIFKTDVSMMVLGQIADAYEVYRDCEFPYGFLPCPKYDENQKDYISGCTDLPWAIPKTATDAQIDIIGTVVEALSAKNYAGVLPVYFETVMKARIADSPDDAEMLQIIADGRTISFAMQYGLEYYNTLKELIVGNKEVASYYQGKAEAAQNKLDTLIESFDEWQ